jgi:hypothetical protein
MQDVPSQESLIERSRNALKDLFLQKKQSEFQAFEAEILSRERVLNLHRDLSAMLQNRRQQHSLLEERIAYFQQVDLPNTMLRGIESQSAGAASIDVVANQVVGIQILKTHGPALVKLSAKELSTAEESFSKFVRENEQILREEGKI